MLIYEKKDGSTRKLYGTMGTAPSANDSELSVTPAFDFVGPYFYKAPGGIMTANGTEVTVAIGNTQIIPPVEADLGEIDTTKDEFVELVDDKGTTDTSDDVLKKVYTKDELNAMTKATIIQMASVLGYTGIDATMTKAAIVNAFLTAQDADTRKPAGGNGGE